MAGEAGWTRGLSTRSDGVWRWPRASGKAGQCSDGVAGPASPCGDRRSHSGRKCMSQCPPTHMRVSRGHVKQHLHLLRTVDCDRPHPGIFIPLEQRQ